MSAGSLDSSAPTRDALPDHPSAPSWRAAPDGLGPNPPRLRMEGIRKSFGGTLALRDVSFELQPGEAHALIGENGAGKSTLMKILSGALRPDAGAFELDGRRFEPRDPWHARRSGIAMIYQELSLAPHLTVEENILLGGEPTCWGWLRRGQRRDLARAALAELRHENIPPGTPVGTLTIAEQQVVEIARALIGEPKVIIMDEPTSSLSRVDAERLFAIIQRLSARGVSTVYISHFLEECQRVCQRYTVLRDGRSVGAGTIAGATMNHLVQLMVGREIQEVYPERSRAPGGPLLEFRALSGRDKPRAATLRLRQGEILGIAGLVGAGRTEMLRTAFGLDAVAGGVVVVGGMESTRGSPKTRLAQGIGLLSENRKEEGLMLNRSLADNLTLTRLRPLAPLGWINRGRQHAVTADWMRRLEVRAQGPDQPVGQLSGGNQQKIALARLLHHDARVFLLDEPTRGIDVGSKVQIYHLMARLAASGRAILFVSSYLPELLGMCDTLGVMCRGNLSDLRPVESWTEHAIILAALGQTDEPVAAVET
ncbi:MAG: sugar ABC transporter ATP-binding protein [Limisphaerales bacterium]